MYQDTLYNLFQYTNPKHNIIFGNGFIMNKLFEAEEVVEYNKPIRYMKIKPRKRNLFNYEEPFHVFISTNTGHIKAVADIEDEITIDFFNLRRYSNQSLINYSNVRITANGVNLCHNCYGLFIDSQFNTDKDMAIKTLYIILLTKED